MKQANNNTEHLKISFCTTCKGRLEHLQQTLPQNIADNRDYPNVEFVVVDYNSNDGMQDWIKENFQKEMESGLLKYVRTDEPEYWQMSHAKNMSHRMATGDVLVNLDADNFTGKNAASWLNDQFKEDPNIVLRPSRETTKIPGWSGSAAGRIAITKENFDTIRGYDEEIKGWGKEDSRFIDCTHRLGLKWQDIPIELLGGAIMQPYEEKIANYDPQLQADSLKSMYAKGTLDKMQRAVERLVDREMAFVNSSGNCGCGTVYVNFSKTPEVIEPLPVLPYKNITPDKNIDSMEQFIQNLSSKVRSLFDDMQEKLIINQPKITQVMGFANQVKSTRER